MWRGPNLRLFWAIALFMAAGILIGYYSARPPEKDEPLSIVPLLSSIRKIGQLHAVRYDMRDVLEHERKLEPGGILRSLPGAAQLYGAVTRNRIRVNAVGG